MKLTETIKCIILEDELPAAAILERHIARLSFLQLVGKTISAMKALQIVAKEQPSLIFLDINLPGASGISFAKSLPASTSVIFTTAYTEYAAEGFELEAIDYLLKPISFERFTKAVNRFLKYRQQHQLLVESNSKPAEEPFIFIKCERRMTRIMLHEVRYFEAQRNYVLVYTDNEVHRTYMSISEMEEKLPEEMFVRIHRSFIVAKSKVSGYTRSHVFVNNNEIPIGRHYNSVAANFFSNKQDG